MSAAASRPVILAGLALTIAALGPAALFASETVVCDAPLLTATHPEAGAQLGWALDAQQNGTAGWLAAGANLDDRKGADSGAVVLYLNPQPGAVPNQEIVPDDLQPGDQFGTSISIGGEWLAVGAPFGDRGVHDSGVVYLYHLEAAGWVQRAKLDAADARRGDRFGASVSLRGATLTAGAPDSSARGSRSGAAYVFELRDGAWSQTAKIQAGDGQSFDNFGAAVALAEDEGILVAGSPFADHPGALKNFGAAYVFRRAGGPASWVQDAKLTAGATYRPDNLQFGSSVAIGGGRIAVGVPGDDAGNRTDSGSAYVFERNGSAWTGRLLIVEDPGRGEQLGAVVRFDGARVLVGARFDGEGGTRAGAAYVFDRQGDGSWTQTRKLLRQAPGSAFGQSVAVLDQGILLGGFQTGVSSLAGAGAVAPCFSAPPPPPPPAPKLVCTKSGPSSVAAGETLTYEIEVANQGGTAAAGVVLNDPTPNGLTRVSVSGPCQSFPCSLGSLGPGAELPSPVKVKFQVPACPAANPIRNVASVSADGVAAVGCTARTSIVIPAQVACEKSGPPFAKAGETIAYQVTARNPGCAPATNVTVSDPVPPGLEYVSGPCVQSSCNLGTIGPGQSAPPVTTRFRVLPGCREEALNLATVSATGAAAETCQARTVLLPDLAVDVSAPASVAGGDELEVTVLVANAGPPTARKVALSLAVTGADSVTQIPSACVPVPTSSGLFLCTLAEIRCGAPAALVFHLRAPACPACGAPGPITATATLTTADAAAANNQDSASISVSCPPPSTDLAITKQGSPGSVLAGATVTYTLTVRNVGCAAVAAATVTDVIPPDLLNPRWCRDAGSPCTPTIHGDLHDTLPLAAGATAVYRVQGTAPLVCGFTSYANTATLSPPPSIGESNPADNTSSVTTLVALPGMSFVNTAAVAPSPGIVDADGSNNTAAAFTEVVPRPGVSALKVGAPEGFVSEGDTVTYTVTLINCGPNAQGDNPGNEFTDTLPAGLTVGTPTASSGTISAPGVNPVTWNGSIPVGGSVTLTIPAVVNPGTGGMTLSNQGTVFFDGDGNSTNESSALSDDPNQPGESDPVVIRVLQAGEIPTLHTAGLLVFMLLLAALTLLRLKRRAS